MSVAIDAVPADAPALLALASVGEIAKASDVPIHRVQYIVRTRGIKPKWAGGNLRLFDREAQEAIRRELGR